MRIFIGVDPRDVVSYNVLRWSIEKRASGPVSITPLILPQLPITRKGLTEFTFSRYLVPAMCGYEGKGLFLDSDMLCLGDVRELLEIETYGSVAVVKNQERFEWPSMMLFDCGQCQRLTVQMIDDPDSTPQDMEWADGIDELPPEWNHCVGYDEPREDAKLVHYTTGTPHFKERRACEYAPEWWAEYRSMTAQASWLEIHGHSIHRDRVLQELGFGAS